MKSFAKQYPILSFIVATYAFSWTIWIVTILAIPDGPQIMGIIPGAYGPTVIAIVITAVVTGKSGLKKLLSKFLVWRVGIIWYLVIFLLFPLTLLVVILIYGSVQPGTIGSFAPRRLYMWLLGPLLALPLGPLGEELGWRGYLLPRLQGHTNALKSSLILGVVWTFWHTPLFWASFGTLISGNPVTVWSVGIYLVQVTILAILFTWVYNNTKGSVLLAILLHAVFNATIPFQFFPNMPGDLFQPIMQWYTVALGLVALAIILIFGQERLSRQPLVEGETMISGNGKT